MSSLKKVKKLQEANSESNIQALTLQLYIAMGSMDYMDEESEEMENEPKEDELDEHSFSSLSQERTEYSQ